MPDFPTVTGVAGFSVSNGPDPLTDAVTRLLTVPFRELYAVLWRAGVVEIDD
ncbi:Rv1535 domain-containing protein [Mycobacterium sp. JS623]|uniref:Rv1535 domain-containing protein n=1 Tax=Mycobacterium sp. JS623 TaxID=212767 RepID=UPI003FA60816